MKKFVLMLAAFLLAAPAWATVDVSCAQVGDTNEVVVTYNATGGEVRCFGLDIKVDSGTIDAVVVPNDPNYRIFPGQIVIQGNTVTDYNAPYTGALGANSYTVEMCSLYTWDQNYAPPNDPNLGYGKQPGSSGELFRLRVSDSCKVSIEENGASGGIVMLDGTSPSTNLPCPNCCEVSLGCYTGPDYAEWVKVGRPDSWCNPRQCHGDADDAITPYGPGGMFKAWVEQPDLNLLIAGFREAYCGDPAVDTWIAADFDHQENSYGPGGMFKARVEVPDLTILITYFRAGFVPDDCLTDTPVSP